MAKIMQTELIYKCGCSWTEQYTRGASVKEIKQAKYWASTKACPKCERMQKDDEVYPTA